MWSRDLYRALTLLAFLAVPTGVFAFDVENYSPDANDLYNPTTFPSQIQLNTSPNFVGAGYDFSSLSFVGSPGEGIYAPGRALITPQNVITAEHAQAGGVNIFLGANGTETSVTVPGSAVGSIPGTDLGEQALSSQVTDGANDVNFAPILDLATQNPNTGQTSYANWVGQSLILNGRNPDGADPNYSGDGTSPRVAAATIQSVFTSSSDPFFVVSAAASGVLFISGDSSGPAYIPWTNPAGQKILTAVGVNDFVGGSDAGGVYSGIDGLEFLPTDSRLAALNQSMMTTTGYVVEMVGNASQTWVGGNGKTFGQAGAWAGVTGSTPVTPGSYSYLSFDPTQSASQTVNLTTGSVARGLIFNPTAAGDTGYTLTGGSLALGRGGLFNYSTQTQTIASNVSLTDSQWWNAQSGNINVTGNIDLSGGTTTAQMLVVSGNYNTTLSGNLTGNSNDYLAKYGTGSLTVSNPSSSGSTWAGATTWVHEGTLVVKGRDPLGGSTINVQSGATIVAASGSRLDNNVSVASGAVAAGTGLYDYGIGLVSGSIISPGDTATSIGQLTTVQQQLVGGAIFDAKVGENPNGSISFNSLSVIYNPLYIESTAADPFIFKLDSLGATTLGLTPGQTYQWALLTTANSLNGATIQGFSASDFAIDQSDFISGGTASLSESANDETIYLDYTAGEAAVPEPSTFALLGAGAVVLFVFRCRGRFQQR